MLQEYPSSLDPYLSVALSVLEVEDTCIFFELGFN